jgi:hypothetical protein
MATVDVSYVLGALTAVAGDLCCGSAALPALSARRVLVSGS